MTKPVIARTLPIASAATLVLLFATLMMRGPVTCIGPLAELVRDAFGASYADYGLLAALPIAAFGLFRVPGPATAARLGLRGAVLASIAVVTLGAWAHLVADHVYNAHTRAYLASIGMEAGERARIGKQGDFALFGRTLDISMVPQVNGALLAQCRAFPPYTILPHDVEGAVESARRIVEKNRAEHLSETPDYQLLTADFFDVAREEAHATIVAGLRSRL